MPKKKNESHPADDTMVAKAIKKPSQRRLSIVVLVVIAVVLIGSCAVVYRWISSRAPTGQICTTEQIDKANIAIAGQKIPELGDVVGQIQQQKDYGQDPNCLYIVTEYYVQLSEPQNAELNYTLLQQRFDAVQNTSFKLQYNQESIKQLGEDVVALQERAEQFLRNQFYGPNYQHPEGYTNPNTQGASQ